jgi:transposase
MEYIQGKPRSQIVLFESSLEERIDKDNPVRIIDLFVDSLDMMKLGFTHARHAPEGRPPYYPGDLLKLFIYAYLNRIRSSRLLERECSRNLELMWLLKELTPDHNTIANFRKENSKAIKAVFRKMVIMCKKLDLIGGKVIATDGTKFRAQNSKKNNYNQKKIDDHLRYIETKLQEYLHALEFADTAESMGFDPEIDREQIKERINNLKQKKQDYKKLEQQLKETGQEQLSTTDPDSRKMPVRQQILEVCYNVQTSVDDKHYLPIDFKTTNNNDTHALANMAQRSKIILGKTGFTELADKGYHTGEEIRKCHQMGIETLVAVPRTPVTSQAPDPAFNMDRFHYDRENDCYFCPPGFKLTSIGTWYHNRPYKTKQYKTKDCQRCHWKEKCTTSPGGRVIECNENIDNTIRNKKAIEQNKELYKRRQQIVEHPFGTMKRQWGFDYTLMKGLKKVDGEVGLIFIAYLFTRLRSILGLAGLRAAIAGLLSCFFDQIRVKKRCIIHFGTISGIFLQKYLSKNQFPVCFVTLPYN